MSDSFKTWPRWHRQKTESYKTPYMNNLKFYATIAIVAYIGGRVIDMILAKVLPAASK